MQIPYSKLFFFFGMNVLFVIRFPNFMTNLLLNTDKNFFYLNIYKLQTKIIQENAFSEASFRTIVRFLFSPVSERKWQLEQ